MAKTKKDSKVVKQEVASLDYEKLVRENKRDMTAIYNPLMVLLLIIGSFFLGRLSLEVSNLKKEKSAPAAVAAGNAQPTEAARPIDVPSMKALAKTLGMDTNKFNQCLDGGTYATRVADEQKVGQNLGVSGTPSFFINGLLIVGAQPQSSFEAVIEAELKNGGGAAEAKKLGEDGKRNVLSYGVGPVKGATNAKIKIVEFTDFECPYCERAFPAIEALMKKYEGKISLEYRSFPLPFHPLAQKAAEGALCANDQGKFWEMHDTMFTASK